MYRETQEITKSIEKEREDFYWLNEDSITFLKRGYLLPGTEPIDRIRYIADYAEKKLGIPGFSNKFYHYMARGYYSLASPIWSNYGLERALPISCVSGETWINTDTGGKQAKDIVVGDMVLTHKNRYRPVTAVIPTKDKDDIYRLKVGTRMTNLYITGNHPVLTNLGWVKVEDLDPTTHLVAVNGQVDHVGVDYTIDMKEYVHYDFLVQEGLIVKKNSTSNEDNPVNHSYSKPAEFVEVDEDLAWAFGLWFAEGSLSVSNSLDDGVKRANGIRITLNVNDRALGERWNKIISSKFNINTSYYDSEVVRDGKLNSWINVNAHSVAVGKLFDSFGRGCKVKQIPEWMMNSPKENLRSFLTGILEGDGTPTNSYGYTLTVSNPHLVMQLYKIGLILGLDMSLQMQEKPSILSTTTHVYRITFRDYINSLSRSNAAAGVKFSDGLIYCPIKTLEKTDRVEDVFDFTVEEDHSFSCAGVIVHNCFNSVSPDSVEGIMYTTAEIGQMSKIGGGTSVYMGKVRPRGSPIKDNGQSDGSFNFLKLFDSVVDVISQGSCYEEGTEVLTSNGFKDFRLVDKETDKLAQVDEFMKVSFTSQYDLIEEPYKGDMYRYSGIKKDSLVDLSVTPNHRMVVEYQGGSTLGPVGKYWTGIPSIVEAKDLVLGGHNRMYMSAEAAYDGPDLSFADRFRIAFQADGRKDGPNRKIRFRFVKQRKIDRLLYIIENLGIIPEVIVKDDGVTEINIPYIEELKHDDFSWIDLTRISRKWCVEFINELVLWDGTVGETGTRTYVTTNKVNAEIAQAIGVLSFQRTRIRETDRSESGRQPLYVVTYGYVGIVKGESIKTELVPYDGKVYCATVPTGMLIVRRNGRTMVCGNSRRGACAAYIDIDHPDIHEWLNIHTEGNPIQLMYYGVCVGSDWLKEMREGDTDKRTIWAKVLQRRSETGIPYIFFKDNANNNKPQVYKDKDMTIYGSNLCVSGDTTILTKEYGHTPIAEHVNESVTVWNGSRWSSNVKLEKTNTDQELYSVTVSTGASIKCTRYHKWYVVQVNSIIEKRTHMLEKGDILEGWTDNEGLHYTNITIDSVEKIPGLHDTYCCTEPDRHRVIFNGIMTGNCNEISLPSSEEESFVCCLSSLNLHHYDEWKDTDAVETMVYFLDTVLQEFIDKAKNIRFMERAVRFAERHRAIGIGVLGWHTYLQSKMIPFGGLESMMLNNQVFKLIKDKSYKASEEMAKVYGEPELLKGYGMRHTTTMSIAPTKSSSFILGSVSPSIEPLKSNYYVKDLAKIKTTYKNPYLQKLLKEKGKDTQEVWDSILKNDGSVQHLEFLSQDEKDVFKTFAEISQLDIIQLAAVRQKYIDQGQSLNVMIHPDTPTKDINELYLKAHDLGIKGLYYQFSMSAAQKFNRSLLNECSSCES